MTLGLFALLAVLAGVAFSGSCIGPQIEYIGALCGSGTSCLNTANSTFYSTNMTRTGSVAATVGWTGVVYSPDSVARIIDRANPPVLIFDDWVQVGAGGIDLVIYHYNIRISVNGGAGIRLDAMSGTFTQVVVCTGCAPGNTPNEITVWVNAPNSVPSAQEHWLMVRVNQAATATVVVDNFPFDYTYSVPTCGAYCPIYVTSNAVAAQIHFKSAVFTDSVYDEYLEMMYFTQGYRDSLRQLCTNSSCPNVYGTLVDYTSTLNTIYAKVLGIDALMGNETVALDYLRNLTIFLTQYKIDVRTWIETQGINIQTNFTYWGAYLQNLSTRCDAIGVSINSLLAGGNFTQLNSKLDALSAVTNNVATWINNGFFNLNANFTTQMAEMIHIEQILAAYMVSVEDFFAAGFSFWGEWNASEIISRLDILYAKCLLLGTTMTELFSTQTVFIDGRFNETVAKLDELIAGVAELGVRLDRYFWAFNDALGGNVSLLLERINLIINDLFPALTTHVDDLWQSGIDFMSEQFDIIIARLQTLENLLISQNSTLYELFFSQTVYLDSRFDLTYSRLQLLSEECLALNLTFTGLFMSLNDYLVQEFADVAAALQQIYDNLGGVSVNVELVLSKLDLFSAEVMANLSSLATLLIDLQDISVTNGININTMISTLNLQSLVLANHTAALDAIQSTLDALSQKCNELGISLEFGFNLTLFGLGQINFTLNSLAEMFPRFAENISRIETKIDALQYSCSGIQIEMWQSFENLSLQLDQRIAESNGNRTQQFLVLHEWLENLTLDIGVRFNITAGQLVLIGEEFSHSYELIYNATLSMQPAEDEELIRLNRTEIKLDRLILLAENGTSMMASISARNLALAELMTALVAGVQNTQQLVNCVIGSRCDTWQWWDGSVCVDNTCFGVNYRTRGVCSGNGACVKYNRCHCYDGSWGDRCQHRASGEV